MGTADFYVRCTYLFMPMTLIEALPGFLLKNALVSQMDITEIYFIELDWNERLLDTVTVTKTQRELHRVTLLQLIYLIVFYSN